MNDLTIKICPPKLPKIRNAIEKLRRKIKPDFFLKNVHNNEKNPKCKETSI